MQRRPLLGVHGGRFCVVFFVCLGAGGCPVINRIVSFYSKPTHTHKGRKEGSHQLNRTQHHTPPTHPPPSPATAARAAPPHSHAPPQRVGGCAPTCHGGSGPAGTGWRGTAGAGAGRGCAGGRRGGGSSRCGPVMFGLGYNIKEVRDDMLERKAGSFTKQNNKAWTGPLPPQSTTTTHPRTHIPHVQLPPRRRHGHYGVDIIQARRQQQGGVPLSVQEA